MASAWQSLPQATARKVHRREAHGQEVDAVNRVEAFDWVHTRLIVGDMALDELAEVFTVLTGHRPDAAERSQGLFRRCFDEVVSMPCVAVPAPSKVNHRKARASSTTVGDSIERRS